MIDIVLSLIFGILALAATFMLPSNTDIQNNKAQDYKSKKMFITIAGIGAIAGGVIILVIYIMDDAMGEIINMVKMAFLMIIGVALVIINNQRSKTLAQHEAAGFPESMQTAVPAPQFGQGIQQPVQTVQQQQYVAAQQIGVKQMPQQVPVQQQTVATTQVAPQYVQPQQQTVQKVAVQQPIQAQPQPQATQKPRIIMINCPKCKGKMQIDTRMLGQRMKCPHCGVEGKIG